MIYLELLVAEVIHDILVDGVKRIKKDLLMRWLEAPYQIIQEVSNKLAKQDITEKQV